MKTSREIQILLTKARRDPYYVFTNKDCATLAFCDSFFELCNELMYREPAAALEQSFVARRLAKVVNDAHMRARATGMVSSGYRIEGLHERAARTIQQAEHLAGECKDCHARLARRKGHLAYHQMRYREAEDIFTKSLELYEALDDREGMGSVLIFRGAALCMQGSVQAALRDERQGLALLSHQTPERFLIAGMTNLAAVLAHDAAEATGPQLDDALELLGLVRSRLKGQRRQHEHTRVILRWIQGLISAKRGDRKSAFRLLQSARNGIKRLGLHSEYLVITADLAKLYKINSPRHNDDQVIDLAIDCLQHSALSAAERHLLEDLRHTPELAAIETLRSSITTRMPALI